MSSESIDPALPIGRVFRVLLGIFFLYEVHDVYLSLALEGIFIRIAWAFGLFLFYLILHLIVTRLKVKANPTAGFFMAWLPVSAVFAIGYGGPAATGALTFLGLTLILAGIRADPGCEVMSFPALISGKHTHLLCPLFSPLDWIEKRFSKTK